MCHHSIDDLDSVQLASMLSMGLDDLSESGGEDRAAALGSLLDSVCVVTAGDSPQPRIMVLPDRYAENFAATGRRLADLVTDPGAPTPVLRAVKDFAKARARATNGADSDAATALYLAAIAAALVNHDATITSRPLPEMAEHFETFRDTPWCSGPLRTTFERAFLCCTRRHD